MNQSNKSDVGDLTLFSRIKIKKQQCLPMISLMGFILFSGKTYSQEVEKILEQDLIGLNSIQKAQIKVEELDDEKNQVIEQFRQIKREQQLADKYQQLLTKQVSQLEYSLSQIDEKQSLLRNTRMTLGPLMEEMVKSLENLVDAGAPFLLEERKARIDNLKTQMSDATRTQADNILSILDAYQVELSYGYTTESWQAKLDGKLVNFVRVGRLGFYYYTPDESLAASWQQGWQPLSTDWIPNIKQAAAVASGTQLPSILTLPSMNIETM